MNQEKLHELSMNQFQLGKYSVTLLDLVGSKAIERTIKKFSQHYCESEIYVSIREFIRFLHLTAISDTTLFFPGNRLMDDVWHSFIVETKEYRLLCSKIRPGYFLEHSGMIYEDYSATRSAENLNEEQISWLVSYLNNFGPISEESFSQLLLAQELSKKYNLNRDKLNLFAEQLLLHAKKENLQKVLSIESYLSENTLLLETISKNPQSLESVLKDLLELKSQIANEGLVLLSNEELELIYSSSTTLGFTLLQHLAAVERLIDYKEWQNKNKSLWNELSTAKKTIGLGTTHLAHGGPPLLAGISIDGGYVLTGTIPWATGTGIFDFILLAFESVNERVFCIIPFPTSLNSTEYIQVQNYKLSCMNATSTCKITFKDYKINSDQVIFSIDKNTSRANRKSRYVFPELGMAVSAICETENILALSENPRHLIAKKEITNINLRLSNLRKEIADSKDKITVEISFKKDELIRDSVRLLTLVAGGRAMAEGTLASRLYLEVMLLDVIIQDPLLIEKKIDYISHE